MKPCRAVVFDLDGTLVDTIEDIHASMAHALGAAGLAPAPRERVLGAVGGGVARLIERLVPDPAALMRRWARDVARHVA